jgi:hypothetical protein
MRHLDPKGRKRPVKVLILRPIGIRFLARVLAISGNGRILEKRLSFAPERTATILAGIYGTDRISERLWRPSRRRKPDPRQRPLFADIVPGHEPEKGPTS